MIIDISKKTDQEVNTIINFQTDVELVNAMGFRFALPLIYGDILEIKYCGSYQKETKKPQYLGQALWLKSDREMKSLNCAEDKLTNTDC